MISQQGISFSLNCQERSVVAAVSQVWESSARSLPGDQAGKISWHLACKGPLASLLVLT